MIKKPLNNSLPNSSEKDKGFRNKSNNIQSRNNQFSNKNNKKLNCSVTPPKREINKYETVPNNFSKQSIEDRPTNTSKTQASYNSNAS